MKVVISGKAFAKKYRTGVQRYCIELLKELDKQKCGTEIELLVPKYCDEEFKYKNIKVVKFGKLNLNIWEQTELPLYALKNKAILVNLCNTSPILKPDIVCIHDLNCIKNPQYYPKLFSNWYKMMVKNAIKKAKKIITVSRFSKSEIENYYNIKDIEVIYNGYEHIFRVKADDGIFKKLQKVEKNRYFFTLGTIQKNKNIEWILKVAKLNTDKTFVITGYMNQENIKFDLKNVIYTGYLQDEELKALMENCEAYIIPSFYEGFGIPPLEAFALGKNVIASDIPVFHEIFEDEIKYINPYEYNVNLNELVDSQNRQKILDKFSWEKSAEELLNIIEEQVKK